MPEVSLSGSLNYVPPGGGTVNQSIVSVGSYLASSLGTLDIPSGAGAGATFSIPLGGVANPIALFIKSSVGTSCIVKMQGNPTGTQVTDSGVIYHGNSRTPGVSPISSLFVQLISAQTATGTIDYEIFGD